MEYLEELRELETEAVELCGDTSNLVRAILTRARQLIILTMNQKQEGMPVRQEVIVKIEELLYEADNAIKLTLN